MAEAMGKDWCRDRKEVVDYINRFREDLYLLHPELMLFTDKFYCLKVSSFPQDCGGNCQSAKATYYGVTLPSDIDGVIAVWEDFTPMRTYSKWWEGRVGIITKDQPRYPMTASIVPETFATEQSLTHPSKLSFFSSSSQDGKKLVVIKVDTADAKNQEIHVTLSGNGIVKTVETITAIHSVVLPYNLQGTVTLMQEDGHELSEYGNYDSVPRFRRLKLALNCSTGKILLQGSLAFRPIFHDTDIVEVGSRRIIETAARIYRYGESGTDTNEGRKAQMEEQRLKELLGGAMRRKRGEPEQDLRNITRKRILSNLSLPGYGAGNSRFY